MASVHPPQGREQQARAHNTTAAINSMQTQPAVQITENDSGSGPISNEFPAQLVPRDEYDDVYAIKQRNAARNPYTGAPTQFVQEITKEDLDYQKRKQEVVNQLRYKKWLADAIDMSDPNAVSLARERGVLKDYFDDREKLIDYAHDLSRQIAKMRLNGRSTWGPEEYKLAFAIKSGVLELPKGSLMDPSSYRNGKSNDANIKRGFFNPNRLFPGMRSRYLRNHEDPFPDLTPGVAPQETYPDSYSTLGGLFDGFGTGKTDYNIRSHPNTGFHL